MLSKIKRRVFKWGMLIFNILLLPFFATIFLAILLCIRLKKGSNKNTALFVGLEHVIRKTVVRADQLKNEYSIFFYSFELNKSPNSGYPIIKSKRNIVFDLLQFGFLILKENPKYCEIYFEGRGFRQWYQSVLLKFNNTMTIAVLRGELYYYHSNMSNMKKYFLEKILNMVEWIYYRETYMLEILNNIIKDKSKIVFDSNKVKVFLDCNLERDEKKVLFLNGFKDWRRLDIVIDAIPKVVAEVKDVNFVLIGARSQKELDKYKSKIKKGYEKYVTLLEWTKDSKEHYEQASVFVLPADLVYLNFSLLEAMERGVPAIVSDVEDVEKIIAHGKDGIIAKQNSNAFAKEIIGLLTDEKLRFELARNAREKIVSDFNDKNRMDSIKSRIGRKYER
ncbi:glycosyltransferase family 4 protein [Flavobacteriaceae bacterium S356]|uniref:Glycosyltransferase family 4 protein n=1 Tax=Asprobacillus argus TaxID=3076534 RepID=A0ABU3LJT3_9FLAO|nr:glycosyltransferase family 4 protein [Flavobacteriaceae bacterium S356]